jgi:hypothetical protein
VEIRFLRSKLHANITCTLIYTNNFQRSSKNGMGSISNAFSSSARRISKLEFVKSLCRVLSIGKSKHDTEQLGTIGEFKAHASNAI